MDELPKTPALLITELRKDAHCEKHGAFESNGFQMLRHVHWSDCSKCSEEKKQEQDISQAKFDAQRAQERAESMLNRAGIPLRFRNKDFNTYIADTDGKEKALSVAMQFASDFEQHSKKGTVAVFSGLPGTGKSHLAIAVAQAILANNTVLYISAIDAIRLVRDTWRKGSEKTETEVLEQLASIDLLILDEIGVQYGKDSEQITLFDIIDKRYRDMRPMILLTNQNRSGMKEFLGDRSFDRLREGGIWVTFDWPSERGNQ